MTASVSLEIKASFEAEFKASFFGTGGGTKVTGEADSKISAGWEHSLKQSETWTQTSSTSIHVSVPPGMKAIITKLTGTYGTKGVPIYEVYAKDYNIYHVKCKVWLKMNYNKNVLRYIMMCYLNECEDLTYFEKTLITHSLHSYVDE